MNILNALKYVIRSASYGVVLAVVILLLMPELRNKQLNQWLSFDTPKLYKQPLSYANAVRSAGPAVVNIYSEEIQSTPVYGGQPRKNTVLGSGVIMQSQGYILTNYHVVQSADLIVVVLQRGQKLHAELIGYDVLTDLAVLKVQANNLPVIPQRMDQVSQVGDVVLAIGNPLNLGQTVTQGIISATGQSGLSTSYLQFLQMDAAVNKGNSGGALVDSNGDLVGINSRLFRQSNGNGNIQGIFFAVPYQLAHKVMMKIIEHGRVIRGWLGVNATRYVANFKGFVIDSVASNSPAFDAGLLPGDIVYQIDSAPIQSIRHALDIVADTAPGSVLDFHVYREKDKLTIPVTIKEVVTVVNQYGE